MGFAVQHTGEIDADKLLEQLWVFGKPTGRSTDRCKPISFPASNGAFAIGAMPDVRVELFGDAADHPHREIVRVDRSSRRRATAIETATSTQFHRTA
jgi:hypothetical protein